MQIRIGVHVGSFVSLYSSAWLLNYFARIASFIHARFGNLCTFRIYCLGTWSRTYEITRSTNTRIVEIYNKAFILLHTFKKYLYLFFDTRFLKLEDIWFWWVLGTSLFRYTVISCRTGVSTCSKTREDNFKLSPVFTTRKHIKHKQKYKKKSHVIT